MAQFTQPLPKSRARSHMGIPQHGKPFSSTARVRVLDVRGDVGSLHALVTSEDDETTDPRAEGACLFDLTPAEWRFVRNAPLIGFLMVAGADGLVLRREWQALVSAIAEGKRSSCELFQAVCRELYRERDTLLEVFVSDTFEREQLSEAYRLVSQKLSPEDAERFKECLLTLGRQIAMAAGGWIASLGWLRSVEQRAMAELAKALR